jgi:hypothetical protein
MAKTAGVSAWVLALLACAFCTADAAVTVQQSGSAVQKIIQMLTDMAGKAKIEKKDEEVAFAKFTTWCSQESANLKTDIAKNGEEIELLTASIEKLTDDVKSLGEEISELQASVSKHTADKKAQDEKREKDHAAFLEEQQDFSESVDALERAIAMLQKQDYDRSGSSALLQIQADQKLPAEAKSIVTALIGMDGSGPDYAAPEANAYEFQSGGIVDMLKKLNDEFREKLATCQKEEANSKHAYDMIVADLTDSIENAEKDASEKTSEKDSKAEKKALDKKQLAAVVDMKAENEKVLSSMTSECTEKKLSFEEKQQLRAEEIQAIMKAIEILGSPDVSGAAEKHLALAQAGQAKALVQHLRSANVQTGKGESDMSPRRKVKAFLEAEGDRLKSKDLSLLAQKLAADPFAKVKKMIDDMITRLMEEAKQDAEHEGFCDTELGKNKITRNKLSEDIDMLTSSVENGKSTIMMLTESTATLSKELNELEQAVQEATVLRSGEKTKNAETVKDAEAAQTAIAAATAVLREFYEKAAMATAFVQTAQKRPTMGSEEWNALANPNFKGEVDKGHKAGMQTFGETYQGNQDANNGVMALLEVLASDFAALEADTNAAEAAAKEAYDRFMVESKKNKAVKERKVSMNESDKASAESKLREDIADLKATQDELLAADRYYDKLVPQCLDQGMTFEERTGARAAEIASLKEALKILESNGSVA